MTEREQEATLLLEKEAEPNEEEMRELWEDHRNEEDRELAEEWVSNIVSTVIQCGREEPNGLPGAKKSWDWQVSVDSDPARPIDVACFEISDYTIYVECYEDTVEPSDPKTYAMETSARVVEIVEWLSKAFHV